MCWIMPYDGLRSRIHELALLYDIFTYVCGVEALRNVSAQLGLRRSIICNLRLVCKEWNEVAMERIESFWWMYTILRDGMNPLPFDRFDILRYKKLKLLTIGVAPFNKDTHVSLPNPAGFLDSGPLVASSGLQTMYSSGSGSDTQRCSIFAIGVKASHLVHSNSFDKEAHAAYFLFCFRNIVYASVSSRNYVSIVSLNISDNYFVDDYSVGIALEKLPALVSLDIRNCPSVCMPSFLQPVSSSASADSSEPLRYELPANPCLEEVYVDGCWGLNEELLCQYTGDLFIDMLHCSDDYESLQSSSSRTKVVIIEGRHKGNWVYCNVLRKVKITVKKGGKYPNKYCDYDIFVCETLLYDHAVGFSSSPAFNISRRFLCSSTETRHDPSIPAASSQQHMFMPV